MVDFIMQIFLIGLLVLMGIFIFYLMFISARDTSAFQKLNRFTVLAVLLTFFGLIFLRYSLLNSVLGSILVLLLIRISYVIYIDAE